MLYKFDNHKKVDDVLILEISRKNNMIIIKEIGKGGYSKIYEIRKNNYIFASKIQILKKNDSTEKKNLIEKEMDLIVKLHHYNIIKTLATYKNEISLKIKKKITKNKKSKIVNETETYLTYTYILEKGSFDLNNFMYYFRNGYLLKQKNNNLKIKYFNNLNQILLFNFIQQVLKGIYYLKLMNYITFDLKPENVILNSNLIVKLIDFTLTGKITEKFNLKSFKSTFSIMGPEYYDNSIVLDENKEKIEIFSLGAIIYFLIANKNLYDNKFKNDPNFDKNKNIEMLENSIKNLKENKNYDEKLINFTEKCLNKKIEKRFSINECLQQEFLYEKDKKYNEIMNNNYKESSKIFTEFQKNDFLFKNNKKKFIFKKIKN
jgi:serine/threonine protein kinase